MAPPSQAQEFSHSLLHTYASDAPDADFRRRLQESRLRQLREYEPYTHNFAQNFIGPLPIASDKQAG